MSARKNRRRKAKRRRVDLTSEEMAEAQEMLGALLDVFGGRRVDLAMYAASALYAVTCHQAGVSLDEATSALGHGWARSEQLVTVALAGLDVGSITPGSGEPS